LSHSSGGSAWGGGAYLRGGLLMKYSDVHDNEVRSSPNTQNARGGGIWNAYGGGTVIRSTISNNRGGTVGGMLLSDITDGDEIAILSSTVSGNVATNSRSGAGLYIGYSSGLILDNSTITGNSEDNFENVSYGAGLKLGDNTPATLISSIVSGNVFVRGGGSRPSDIYGEFSTSLAGDHNLIGFSYLMPPPDTIGYLSGPRAVALQRRPDPHACAAGGQHRAECRRGERPVRRPARRRLPARAGCERGHRSVRIGHPIRRRFRLTDQRRTYRDVKDF